MIILGYYVYFEDWIEEVFLVFMLDRKFEKEDVYILSISFVLGGFVFRYICYVIFMVIGYGRLFVIFFYLRNKGSFREVEEFLLLFRV